MTLKTMTTLDYEQRLQKVLDHIADHIGDPLSLDHLAEIACFSPFHFHRIYRGMTGETVADTIRRLRLHRAAADLLQGSLPIARIATAAGYGSVAAFTRSFGAAYGTTPALYRSQGGLVPYRHPTFKEKTMSYPVEIRHEQPLQLACFPHLGDYQKIGDAFGKLDAWAGARGLFVPGTRLIGVYYDDPSCTPLAELRSHAGISVAPGTPLDGMVETVHLQGGRYAVLTHKGPYAELPNSYTWLFGTWLPQSGLEADDRPCFEDYLNDPRQLPPSEWLTEVFLPLKG